MKDSFTADKKAKEAADAQSNEDNRREPDKYKGFWEKFSRETAKKAEERKAENK